MNDFMELGCFGPSMTGYKAFGLLSLMEWIPESVKRFCDCLLAAGI